MTGKRLFRISSAAVLSLAIVFSISVRPAPAQAVTLSELKQKQAALQQKSQSIDAQLKKLKNDKAKQQQYKDALDQKIYNLEQQIDSKNSLIKQLDADILQKQNDISAKQKEIDADFQKLKQRVYALYLTGEASNLEIILNAKNIMDLADKTQILKVISEHDTELMNTLKSDINSIKEQKTIIENNRKEATAAKTQLQNDEAQLKKLSSEAAAVISNISASEQEAAAEQRKCRIDQNAAAAAVERYLASYYSSNQSSKSSGGALSSGQVSAIVSVAKRYIGTPYVWGGCAPGGFDCSGFVSYVLKQCGWSLNNQRRMGVDGLSAYCKRFSGESNARPGDLVFYDQTYGGYNNSHVGIYLGNGYAIQCDSPGVEIVSLNTSYWRRHLAGFGRLP